MRPLASEAAAVREMKHFTLGDRVELSRYDYLWRLSPDRWAWEYLRRNPEFKRAAALRRDDAISVRRAPCVDAKILLPREPQPLADRWGLVLMPDPDLNACDAEVVWNRTAFPDQIELYCITRAPHEPCELWDRVTLISTFTHVTDYTGPEYLLVRCNGAVIQHRCSGVSLLGDQPVRIKLIIDDMDGYARRLKLLEAAFRVYNDPPGPAEPKWTKTTQVLRDGLIALDCLALGGSRKDIANALYGSDRVREEWNGPSMKHTLRYLVKKAEALRDGGYAHELLLADPFAR
ncbi:hypothetical protein CW354_08380 [Marinicaulis flavus]|uniref:DUF2285 domain-containing protein n=2 Tax=Hyphococcus luteus TaxID=2058213 RepID=A0A2S7K752_9PROT|nr:hypothetical protein CW354_08380 [Marinicaulis flavus]